MLELKGISYSFQNGPWLFKELNLTIKPGQIIGLYGKSGSGKTTLAKVISGYIKSCNGTVLIDGRSQLEGHIDPVQLVWQHPEKAINPKWRMKEVLSEVGSLDEELLMVLGIQNEWLYRRPNELSGGELQRFCIARALGPKTKYLIADEMTTMLDAITQAQIWHAVLKLAKERKIGVLAISHDHHLLRRISSQVLNFNEIAFS